MPITRVTSGTGQGAVITTLRGKRYLTIMPVGEGRMASYTMARIQTCFPILLATVFPCGVGEGCASQYASSSSGQPGAYRRFTEEKVGDRAYAIRFVGNDRTPKDVVVEYWHRHASELCGGRDRYVITKDQTLFAPRSQLMAALDQDSLGRGTIKCVDYPAMLFAFKKNPAHERLAGSRRPTLRQDGRAVVELRPGVFFISVLGRTGEAIGSVERVFDALAKASCSGVGQPFLMRHAYKDVGELVRSAYDSRVVLYKNKQIRYQGYVMCIWWKPQGRPVREIR